VYTPNAQHAGTARNVTVRHLLISAVLFSFVLLVFYERKEEKRTQNFFV
tara:strand:- start:572 stop:718 length:147 start_codon:yes stop_codon:yes gene_type:complete